ncbi:MAG: LPD7 domain-containing protein [Phenylobacterium sp.]
MPERLRRRYYTDPQGGPGLGFYVDATATAPAFRDQGRRLSTDRNDPNVIRDLVAIAGHRGWTTLDVRGQTAFRREVWLAARAAGLEVRGYQPTPRDEQDLSRRRQRAVRSNPQRTQPARDGLAAPGPSDRLRIVEAVVRNRIVEPGEQDRVLAAARTRLADWLERGARFAPVGRTPAKDRAVDR